VQINEFWILGYKFVFELRDEHHVMHREGTGLTRQRKQRRSHPIGWRAWRDRDVITTQTTILL